ncbi:SoxR reducing system RseC family protein [Guyparkeria sp.]|uniref:SoxR reducing system RseC family protein n=1 Tax=Guyparkeria sp. TaxID=2035736 RepID=UPI0039708B40
MAAIDRRPESPARGDLVLEPAKVVAVEAGGVWLEAGASAGCANCRDGKGCGVSIFQRLFRLPRHQVYLPTDEPLAVGDHVTVGMSQRALLHASLWLYLAPLLGLLAGALSLDVLVGNEAITVLGALAGLVATLWFVRTRQRRQAASGQFFPVLQEVTLRQAREN